MHCDHARFVWNLGLEQRLMWRRAHKGLRPTVTVYSQCRELTEARAVEPWLGAGSATVQQGALRDLDRAFQNWWSNPSHFGRPSWRKKSDRQGFCVRRVKVERIGSKTAAILIPKVGMVRFRLTYPWERVRGATSARVTLDRAGRWYLSLVVPAVQFGRVATGAVAGIDRGVANTLALDCGRMLQAPTFSPAEQDRYEALTRKMGRQVRGSARREATRRALARMHARLTDRRKDWVEKTTTGLVRDYDLVAVEKLNIRGMVRKPVPIPDPKSPGSYLPNGARAKAGLNRAILGSCWGIFGRRLAEKAARTPDEARTCVLEVCAKNTSRTCGSCGHVSAENRESQAVFCCVACGHLAHADTNAAENILARALNETNRRAGGGRAHQPPQWSRANRKADA